MKISVVGTGYVGLVTGVVLAQLGNDVICIDKDLAKLERLRRGESPIFEPGLEELIQRTTTDGFLTFSDSIIESVRQSEIVFIAVGTPPGTDGVPDVSAVKAVAKEIGKAIGRYTVVVNKSTVPVGAGSLVWDIIAGEGVAPELFDVVSNPEFLREGSAIRDTLEPERIVIGSTSREAATKMMELYAPLQRPTILTDPKTAELIKYASNSFLALKISFINAMSRLCEECGADVADLARGVGSDARIGASFLQAGLGWGGSCFPKDVDGMVAIAAAYGYDFQLLKQVVEINDDQTEHFLERVQTRLGGFSGRTIGLLGLAFKPNTDDIRCAKSLTIIDRVLQAGGALRAFDPVAVDNVRPLYPNVTYCQNPYEVALEVDALLVATEWNEFKLLDLKRLAASMKTPILFDGRRIYKRAAAEKAGFEYFGIGEKSDSEQISKPILL